MTCTLTHSGKRQSSSQLQSVQCCADSFTSPPWRGVPPKQGLRHGCPQGAPAGQGTRWGTGVRGARSHAWTRPAVATHEKSHQTSREPLEMSQSCLPHGVPSPTLVGCACRSPEDAPTCIPRQLGVGMLLGQEQGSLVASTADPGTPHSTLPKLPGTVPRGMAGGAHRTQSHP